VIPTILALNPLRQRSIAGPRQLAGSRKKKVKEQYNTGKLPVRSLDFRGHIGVRLRYIVRSIPKGESITHAVD
jgi:hypothetical protein